MQQVRSKHDVKQQTKNKVSLPATSIHGGSPLEDDPQVISMLDSYDVFGGTVIVIPSQHSN